VPIDRTIGLLTQHLASKTVSLATTLGSQDLQPNRNLLSAQTLNADGYSPSSGYGAYAIPPETRGKPKRTSNSYLPPDTALPTPPAPSHRPQAYPDPQYVYPTPYTNNTSTYVPPSYNAADALPATAAAATAYLNGYPSRPSQHNPHPPPSSNTANYSAYNSPGSQTSWRSWAGDMASNLEPRAEYINSASALMQLGGCSEGPAAQNLQTDVIDESTGQMWPSITFDSGNGAP